MTGNDKAFAAAQWRYDNLCPPDGPDDDDEDVEEYVDDTEYEHEVCDDRYSP